MKKILMTVSLFSSIILYCDTQPPSNSTLNQDVQAQIPAPTKKDYITTFSSTGTCINCDLSNQDLRKIIKTLKDEYNDINLESSNCNGSNVSTIQYTNGGENISTNLAAANLKNIKLKFANISQANLTNAILIGADLTGADLSGANLSGANLTGANLTGASLKGANLTYAMLNNANVSQTDFTSATLTKTSMKSAKLQSTIFTNAMINGTDMTGADMTQAIGYTTVPASSK